MLAVQGFQEYLGMRNYKECILKMCDVILNLRTSYNLLASHTVDAAGSVLWWHIVGHEAG
jgi:hypothetical protein